jgi:general secretion pathway protein A
MYTDFYGLSELPFELNPNPRYLLLTLKHREALANLQYGISARKSLGEAGTGKTTLVRAALESESCRDARVVVLSNPTLTRDEFVEFLAGAFGLSVEAGRSKTVLLRELERELRTRRARGETTALVIDEAQSLSPELLEEVRLLANIETATEKLLPLVLVGQPELSERLNQPSQRQLKQRVALRCSLGLLDLVETAAYIAGRIKIAGGQAGEIFSHDAMELVYLRSGGVPRTISVICDNALVNGFAAEARPIGADVIRAVCSDFDLGPASASAPMLEPPPEEPDLVETATAPSETSAPGGLFSSFRRRRGFSFF